MNEFIKNLIAKYAVDRGVWVAVATWLAHIASKKLGFDVDVDIIVTGLVSLATWAVTHFLHVKTIDKPKPIEVPEIKSGVDPVKIEVPEFRKE